MSRVGDVRGGPPVRRLADWDARRLHELAGRFGTPLYVLDVDRARENYRRFAAAFPDAEVRYAAKANRARPLLASLAEEGCGVECAAAGEVLAALDAGVPTSDVQYTAVNPPARDLDAVVERHDAGADLTVTAGAADTVERLADRGFDGRLLVRVTPDVGGGHHEAVRTGVDPTFGVRAERAPDVVAAAADRGMDVVGLHAHAGSGVADDGSTHRALAARLAEIADAVPTSPSVLDIGGGFGVPYRPDEPPLSLETVAEEIRAVTADRPERVILEPGRYVAADAGVLLTRVNTVKEAEGTAVAGVDAGMTTLLRPALYDAHHELRSLDPDAPGRETVATTVAGPVCESADVLAREHELPAPRRGDLLAVGNAGAYGYAMASRYNARPLPTRLALVGGEVRMVAERDPIAGGVAPEVGDR